jgi:hypothetical protein
MKKLFVKISLDFRSTSNSAFLLPVLNFCAKICNVILPHFAKYKIKLASNGSKKRKHLLFGGDSK